MRSFLCIGVVAALLVPNAAFAAVVVKFDERSSDPPSQVIRFDVWVDTGGATAQGLDAFTIAIDGPDFAPGMRFLPVELPSNAHPYVFAGITGAEPFDAGSTSKQMLVAGALASGSVDVTPTRNGLFTVPVFVPPGTPLGSKYHVGFNPDLFSLGGGPEMAAARPGNSAEFVVPEPAAAGLLPLGMLALRRRRSRK